jgi:integrase
MWWLPEYGGFQSTKCHKLEKYKFGTCYIINDEEYITDHGDQFPKLHAARTPAVHARSNDRAGYGSVRYQDLAKCDAWPWLLARDGKKISIKFPPGSTNPGGSKMPLSLIKRNGSKNWYIRGTYLGTTIFKSSGTDRKSIAKTRQKDIEHRIEKGGGVYHRNFAEACIEYIKSCPDGELQYARRLLDYFKETPLIDIDQAAIEKCVEKLYPDGKPATINRNIITPIAAILHRGASLSMCQWMRVKRRKEPKGRDAILTSEQADALLDAANTKLEPVILLMLTTGCRAGEAIKLEWQDVDLPRNHVTFRDTKNGETYGCHLHPTTVAALANLVRRNDSVFGYTYINRKALNRDFKAACNKAGIEYGRNGGITPHSLRHTYATWLRQNGQDLPSLMALGRWKDTKSVVRYAHVSSDEQKAAIDMLPVQNLCIRKNRTGN